MLDAVNFAKLCHDAGLRVGVYNFSGTLGWELFYLEVPHAKNWEVLDAEGNPVPYGTASYRHYWNRNHPEAQAFYKELIRFAVDAINTDLLHFDNYVIGPGSDPVSVERFRAYLRGKFSEEQLKQAGIENVDAVGAAMTGPPDNLLRRAWLDFSCQSLADSYRELGSAGRFLRHDVLVECNPGGVGDRIHPPIDHGRILQGGEAFWDEGLEPGFADGKLRSRIRTYKVARRMDNMAFAYTTSPLECAESMAFNRDCFGCICWFEYDNIVAKPGSKDPVSEDIAPYVRFFHEHRDLFRNMEVMADVAIWRSFASQVFSGEENPALTAAAEETLIRNRIPFQIIYDDHMNEVFQYPVLVLAGCVAMSDAQVAQVKSFVANGGRMCIIGPAATHDEWMNPREKPALDEIRSPGVTRVESVDALLESIAWLCQEGLSARVDGPEGLCAEYLRQPGRRLVHLVNYRSDGPAENVAVRLRLPEDENIVALTVTNPQHGAETELPYNQGGEIVEFVVPKVDVYEIVTATYE
jgi:hypothetical protein